MATVQLNLNNNKYMINLFIGDHFVSLFVSEVGGVYKCSYTKSPTTHAIKLTFLKSISRWITKVKNFNIESNKRMTSKILNPMIA